MCAKNRTLFLCTGLLIAAIAIAPVAVATTEYNEADLTASNDDDYDPQIANVAAYLPKPFAFISMVCSYVMVREIVADHRRQHTATDGATGGGDPIKRMLLSNAVADFMFSSAYFLTTWPSPHDTSWGITGNVGNILTCTFQGFFIQFGFVASVLFSSGLSIFYLLTIQFGWRSHDLEKIEKIVQGAMWVVALAAAIYPIPLELYNNNYEICWLDSSPGYCSGEDCIRGSNPRPHQLAFVIFPWTCLTVVLAVMVRLFWTVRQIENMSKKYATSTVPASPMSGEGDFSLEGNQCTSRECYEIYVDRRKSQAGA